MTDKILYLIASWLVHIASHLLAPILILMYLDRKIGLKITSLCKGDPTKYVRTVDAVWLSFGLLVTWFIVMWGFGMIGKVLIESYPVLKYRYLNKNILPDDGALRVLGAIYLAAVYGVFEEIYFRGLSYFASKQLFRRHGTTWYVLVSSVLFSLIHWGQGVPNLVATFGIGVITSLFFVAQKDIRPLIAAHFTYDLMVLL